MDKKNLLYSIFLKCSKSCLNENSLTLRHSNLSLAISGFFCFLAGGIIASLFFLFKSSSQEVVVQELKPEISLIRFIDIQGDQLIADVSGPVRLLWGNGMSEKNGEIKIPLGQFPNKFDLELRKYFYTGNAKTNKFYPSSSYPARGTEVKYRRFFQTKKAAIAQGFIPSKLVK